MAIDSERFKVLYEALGKAEETPIEPHNETLYYENFLDAIRAQGYTLKKVSLLDCVICGNPHRLRDSDAGTDREIERKCVDCFTPY